MKFVVVIALCLVLGILALSGSLSEGNSTKVDAKKTVIDVNGLIVEPMGNLSCWISHPLEGGEPLAVPLKSKPLYKYCIFMWMPGTGPFTLGFAYEKAVDDYIMESEAENPNQSIFLLVENLKMMRPVQSSRSFFCKTNLCNVPKTLSEFFAFNANVHLASIAAKNETIN